MAANHKEFIIGLRFGLWVGFIIGAVVIGTLMRIKIDNLKNKIENNATESLIK